MPTGTSQLRARASRDDEVRVELTAVDDGTPMVLTHIGVPAESPGAGGWASAMEKRAARLATTAAPRADARRRGWRRAQRPSGTSGVAVDEGEGLVEESRHVRLRWVGMAAHSRKRRPAGANAWARPARDELVDARLGELDEQVAGAPVAAGEERAVGRGRHGRPIIVERVDVGAGEERLGEVPEPGLAACRFGHGLAEVGRPGTRRSPRGSGPGSAPFGDGASRAR